MMASSLAAATAATPEQYEAFRDLIQDLVQQGLTNKAIVAILNDNKGFKTSVRSLQRRLNSRGLSRDTASTMTDELVEAVNQLFHHTLLNDDAIAARIFDDHGLQTTGRQVRSIRSRFNWLRALTGSAKAARTAATRHQVE
jgi:ActR/RegA family two-component response regulator